MDDYVKRSDRQYTDIENFRDYEYTECIAFEMAVRAAKNLLREMFTLIMKGRNPPYPYWSVEDMEKYKQLKEELLNKYWLRDTYFFSKNELWIYNGRTTIKSIHDLNSRYRFYQGSKQFGLYYTFLREELISDEVRRPDPKTEFDSWGLGCFRGWGTKYRSGDHSTYEIESSRDTSPYDKENSIRELEKYMIRPRLVIPKQFDASIDIKINPYLPTEETIKFLENALADIKKGRKARSTYELMQTQPWHEEDFQLEPLYIKDDDFKSKKVVADMFYAYDYITKRKEEIEESNERYKESHREEVQNIENSISSYSDKKVQIEVATRELNDNLCKAGYTKISEEDLICTRLNQKPKTIQRYYQNIKPYIHNMKYKELITGLQL